LARQLVYARLTHAHLRQEVLSLRVVVAQSCCMRAVSVAQCLLGELSFGAGDLLRCGVVGAEALLRIAHGMGSDQPRFGGMQLPVVGLDVQCHGCRSAAGACRDRRAGGVERQAGLLKIRLGVAAGLPGFRRLQSLYFSSASSTSCLRSGCIAAKFSSVRRTWRFTVASS
jgi:hypothetical protein